MTPALDAIRFRMEEAAEEVMFNSGGHPRGAILRAFAGHLKRVSEAVRTVGRELNHDGRLTDQEVADIVAIIGPPAVLAQAMADAQQAQRDLESAIQMAGKV